jgi:hypothetical protein
VLEPAVYGEVRRRARCSGASLSLVVRDLVRTGLEIEEDLILSRVAEARWASFDRKRAVSHAAVKKRFVGK